MLIAHIIAIGSHILYSWPLGGDEYFWNFMIDLISYKLQNIICWGHPWDSKEGGWRWSRFVELSVGRGEREPWARMHGTLPLGQQHYHFINPASRRGEVEGVHTTTILLRRRGQQSTLISPLHPSSKPATPKKEIKSTLISPLHPAWISSQPSQLNFCLYHHTVT